MMPELPEMENYKHLLNERLRGKTITNVQVNREKSINISTELFQEKVNTQKLDQIERRAKHLLFHLDNGNVLLLHLMLGGWMYYGTEQDKPDRTIQIRLSFGDHHLYFIGLRLGYLHLFTEQEVLEELNDLGPEPLEPSFTKEVFIQLASKRRGKLKTTLFNQQFLSGIGNCYSDEICWHAKLLPTRQMNEMNEQEQIQLYHSMRSVLQEAIELGGYMSNPLFKNDVKTGGYTAHCKVYDQEGNPCSRCGNHIVKDKISSRKTFFCAECQK